MLCCCLLSITIAVLWISIFSCFIEAAANLNQVVNSIGFVHMRKAGGSQFVDIVESYMKMLECFGKEVYQPVGAYGIQDGRVSDKTGTMCPNISLAHVEFSCLDGQTLLDSLDEHEGPRLNERFALVTVLRDPIERIGSQAFYGPRNTFGVREINKEVYRLCTTERKRVPRLDDARHFVKSNPKSNFTDFLSQCADQAVANTLERIRSNATMWRAWFEGDVGFGDAYMPNYYIKRLSNLPMTRRYYPVFQRSVECVRNLTASVASTSSDVDSAAQVSFKSIRGECEKSDYLVMKELLSTTECKNARLESEFDPATALAVSKKLLDRHFTVLVLENIKKHPELMTRQLAHVLKLSTEYVQRVLQYRKARQNPGMIHIESSYRETMPLEVVRYLEETNKEDILLYNYIKEKQLRDVQKYLLQS